MDEREQVARGSCQSGAADTGHSLPRPSREELLHAWNADPAGAFSNFIDSESFIRTGRRPRKGSANRALSDSSKNVYTSMFASFARWLSALPERTPFADLTGEMICTFLLQKQEDGTQSSPAIQERYLALLDRCFLFLGVDAGNPAEQAGQLMKLHGQTLQVLEMSALTERDVARFLGALPRKIHYVKFRRGGLLIGWKRRRDRAMQICMLLSGLSVAEVLTLKSGDIKHGGEVLRHELLINIDGKSGRLEHITVLGGPALAELLDWVHERMSLPIEGDLLFPAGVEGRPLHNATVYRQVSATFDRAGLSPTHRGGRTLRNTYVVQRIRNGASSEELVAALGLSSSRYVGPYSRRASNVNLPGNVAKAVSPGETRGERRLRQNRVALGRSPGNVRLAPRLLRGIDFI